MSALRCMADNEPTLKYGDVAPAFTATDTLGVEHSLSDFKNRWVVVEFWASWCGDCRREFSALKSLHGRYGHRVDFISVSFDDKEAAWKTCLRKESFPWLQVSNLQPWKENVISKAYGIQWIPTIYLLRVNDDGEGMVLGSATTTEEFQTVIDKFLFPTDDEISPSSTLTRP